MHLAGQIEGHVIFTVRYICGFANSSFASSLSKFKTRYLSVSNRTIVTKCLMLETATIHDVKRVKMIGIPP